MAVTVRDVAAEAGVSFQLVAAVLGGRKYAHASAATREKILLAARRLGYVPNVSARILRGDPSRILGVLIDSRAPELMYGILAEIEQAAAEKGYRILIAQAHDDPEKLIDSYRSLKQNGVDGILSLSHDYAQLNCHLDDRLKNDPKIVFVLNTGDETASSVDIDLKGAMVAAAEHLHSEGYRKTALLLPDTRPERLSMSCRRRLEGFRQTCPEGNVFALPSSVPDITRLEEECGRLISETLLPGGFDSAITLNDLTAVLLMNQLMAAGLLIPRDFGVVGCDDLPVGECHPVKLTTLGFDRKKLARTALDILLRKIDGNTDPVRTLFPMKLIVRKSSGKKRYEV